MGMGAMEIPSGFSGMPGTLGIMGGMPCVGQMGQPMMVNPMNQAMLNQMMMSQAMMNPALMNNMMNMSNKKEQTGNTSSKDSK